MMLIGRKLLLLLLLLPLLLLLCGLCCVRGLLLCWCSARLAHAGALLLCAVGWMLLLLW
jgi:hypothetical protein